MVGRLVLICALWFGAGCDALDPNAEFDFAAAGPFSETDPLPREFIKAASGVWEQEGARKYALIPIRTDRERLVAWSLLRPSEQTAIKPGTPRDAAFVLDSFLQLGIDAGGQLTRLAPQAEAGPMATTAWKRPATLSPAEADVQELAEHMLALSEQLPVDLAFQMAPLPLAPGGSATGQYLDAPALANLNEQLLFVRNLTPADLKKLGVARLVVGGTRQPDQQQMTFLVGDALHLCVGHPTCMDVHLVAELTRRMDKGPPPLLKPRDVPPADQGSGCSSGNAGGIFLLVVLWSAALFARRQRRRRSLL